MYFDEKLKNLREQRGLSLEEAAQKLDVTEAILEALEAGFKDPDKIEMRKIKEFYKVTEKELADDEPYVNAFSVLFQNNDMSESNLGTSLALVAGLFGSQTKQDKTAKELTVRQTIPLANNIIMQNNTPKYDYVDKTVTVDLPEGEYLALQVNDDKMQGIGIHKGDIAIISLNAQIENNHLVALVKNNETMIRRFIHENDIDILEAADPTCKSEILSSDCFIVGRVVEVKKIF